MPTRYGPSIVGDSIEFHIDAANPKCYNPRENLIVFSQGAFNNTTYWPKVSTTGYTLTDNTTETAAPDGTFTATKITCTTPAQDGTSSFAQDITMPLGTGTYTLSMYLKGSTATGIRIQGFGLWNSIDGFVGANINPIAGTVSNFSGTVVTIADVGNGWRRYSLTAQGNNANNTVLKYQVYLDTSAGITYMWGAQIERTSSPGPYVATTTSQVVKPLPCNNISDVYSIDTVSNSSRTMYDHRNSGSFTFDREASLSRASRTYNFPGGGTVDLWFKLNDLTTTQGIFYISDGGTNLVNFWYNGSKLRWEVARAGVGTQIVTTTTILANTWYHAVGVWDATSTYVYLNGVLEASTTSSNRPTAITGGTAIGTYSSGMNGNISAVKVYNRPLTAAQVVQNFNALRGRYSI